MTKAIDWKGRWEKALGELDEVRKLSEKRRAERDMAIRERNDAIVRADMPRPSSVKVEYIEREVLPFGVAILVFTFLAVCGAFCLSLFWQMKQIQLPILTPYEVRVIKYKDWDNIWKDKCQRAWRVLEHHHSGPNNSRAFAILNESVQ